MKTCEAKTIQERFAEFHAENPWVFADLEYMANQWFESGNTHCSIGMLWEALRWLKGTSVIEDGSGYKLNDHYRSRYARIMIELHPEWRGKFSVRELRTV